MANETYSIKVFAGSDNQKLTPMKKYALLVTALVPLDHTKWCDFANT